MDFVYIITPWFGLLKCFFVVFDGILFSFFKLGIFISDLILIWWICGWGKLPFCTLYLGKGNFWYLSCNDQMREYRDASLPFLLRGLWCISLYSYLTFLSNNCLKGILVSSYVCIFTMSLTAIKTNFYSHTVRTCIPVYVYVYNGACIFCLLFISTFDIPLFTSPCIKLQALAKEIIRSRKTVNRLYENKAQLNSISMHLGESVGMDLLI